MNPVYGMTEKKIQLRDKRDIERQKRFKRPLSEVVNHIKDITENKDKWQKLSYNEIMEIGDGLTIHDKSAFMAVLNSDENIVCRIVDQDEPLTEPASNVSPFEYRYATKEEKEQLGFNAVTYRNITKDIMDKLKAAPVFPTKNSLVNVLNVIDALLRQGADKKWLLLDLHSVLLMTGINVKTLISTLEELENCKILAFLRDDERIACHLVLDPSQYDEITSVNIDDVEIEERDRKTRNSKKAAEFCNIVQSKTHMATEKEIQDVKNFLANRDEVIAKPQAASSDIKAAINELLDVYEATRKRETDEILSIVQNLNKELSEERLNNKKDSKDIETLNATVEMYKAYTSGFKTYVDIEMNMFMADVLTELEKYCSLQDFERKKPERIKLLKANIINRTAALSQSIKAYKADKGIPEEIV